MNAMYGRVALSYQWNGDFIEYSLHLGPEELLRCGYFKGKYLLVSNLGTSGIANDLGSLMTVVIELLDEQLGRPLYLVLNPNQTNHLGMMEGPTT